MQNKVPFCSFVYRRQKVFALCLFSWCCFSCCLLFFAQYESTKRPGIIHWFCKQMLLMRLSVETHTHTHNGREKGNKMERRRRSKQTKTKWEKPVKSQPGWLQNFHIWKCLDCVHRMGSNDSLHNVRHARFDNICIALHAVKGFHSLIDNLALSYAILWSRLGSTRVGSTCWCSLYFA